MTTYLTINRIGAHGDKSARERVLTTFVCQKGLNGAEMPRKWPKFPSGVVEAASSSLVTQTQTRVHNEPPDFLYSIRVFERFGGQLREALFLPLLHSFGRTCYTIYYAAGVRWERIWPAVARRRSTAARYLSPAPILVLRSPDVRAMVLVLPRGVLHKALGSATHSATHS